MAASVMPRYERGSSSPPVGAGGSPGEPRRAVGDPVRRHRDGPETRRANWQLMAGPSHPVGACRPGRQWRQPV